jgi:hypothetical protein
VRVVAPAWRAIDQLTRSGCDVAMPTFRAYLLNPAGKIVRGEWLDAADQAEAERLAHALCCAGTPKVELWKGAQRLAELPCDQELQSAN